MNRCLTLSAVVITCLALSSVAAHAQATAAAASLLITPPGPAGGMGRAWIAAAEGPSSIWWNPAGLAYEQRASGMAAYAKLVPGLADDVAIYFLMGSSPLEGVGGVGLNITYLDYGKSPFVSDEGVEGDEFSSSEGSISAGLGFKVGNSLSLGTSVKLIKVMLVPDWVMEAQNQPSGGGSATSFAVDVGLLYRNFSPFLTTDQLNLALVITNLGPDLVFVDEGQASPLGRIVKLGFMYRIFDTGQWSVRTTYDYNQPVITTEEGASFLDRFTDLKRPLFRSTESPIQNVGAELGFRQGNMAFGARLGYIHDPEGTIEDWTFGLGFQLGMIGFDWSMEPQSMFLEDNVHKFALTGSIDPIF